MFRITNGSGNQQNKKLVGESNLQDYVHVPRYIMTTPNTEKDLFVSGHAGT